MKLRLRHLSVYKGKDLLLHASNYGFEYGYVHAVTGNNGAGKTTLLNSLAGFSDASPESIFNDSREISRESFAYAEQRSFQYNHMTGNDYLRFLGLAGKPEVAEINSHLKLPLDNPTENYSHGMTRKLHLLGALASPRPIVLLDDPFASIDEKTRIFLKLKFRELIHNDRLIIVALQEEKEAQTFADYIHHLENGQFKTSYPGRNDIASPGSFSGNER